MVADDTNGYMDDIYPYYSLYPPAISLFINNEYRRRFRCRRTKEGEERCEMDSQ